jgi:hypothetical protein
LAHRPFGRLSFVFLHLEPMLGRPALSGRLTLGKQSRDFLLATKKLWSSPSPYSDLDYFTYNDLVSYRSVSNYLLSNDMSRPLLPVPVQGRRRFP